MNDKLCIDKRIAYFLVFAVPVFLTVIISMLVNNSRIYNKSKASERPTMALLQPTPQPTKMPAAGTCLVPQRGSVAGTLNLFLKDYTKLSDKRLFKIYSSDGQYFLLLTMAMLPDDTANIPLATIKTSLLNTGTSYTFIALQGDETAISMTGKWGMLSKACAPYLVQ